MKKIHTLVTNLRNRSDVHKSIWLLKVLYKSLRTIVWVGILTVLLKKYDQLLFSELYVFIYMYICIIRRNLNDKIFNMYICMYVYSNVREIYSLFCNICMYVRTYRLKSKHIRTSWNCAQHNKLSCQKWSLPRTWKITWF